MMLIFKLLKVVVAFNSATYAGWESEELGSGKASRSWRDEQSRRGWCDERV
jgi:hypothetical protein